MNRKVEVQIYKLVGECIESLECLHDLVSCRQSDEVTTALHTLVRTQQNLNKTVDWLVILIKDYKMDPESYEWIVEHINEARRVK